MPIFQHDRALLDSFRRGAPDALTRVYRAYVDEVATLARRGFTIESSGHAYVRGFDRDGEYELVQETFAKAFAEKARLAFDGLQPYRPYLLRITKNLMIDRFRANRRQPVALDEVGVGELERLLATSSAMPQGEEPADPHWKQLLAATTEFVATLDVESRQLITMRFDEELSQDDAAERLRCSRRRVRTVERKVQKLLRKWLQKRRLFD
jgi:RNA polymerase sigma-70 factor (ECF subfamily)